MIYIVTPENAAALERAVGSAAAPDEDSARIVIVPRLPARQKIHPEDRAYLDISGRSPAELKKALAPIKKRFSFWGIIDPDGASEDPASFFFEGASDYIGPALIKNGVEKKRFEAAAEAKRKNDKDYTIEEPAADNEASQENIQEPSSDIFTGWKSVRTGTESPFYFLLASLDAGESRSMGPGKIKLSSVVGEAAFNTAKNRLREVLLQNLRDADALLWIETEENYLFLIPPKIPNVRAAVEACLKMTMGSPMISIEKLNLSIHAELSFILHYGETVFYPPGNTGRVISAPVNFIFHLGNKKSGIGRLSVSGSVDEDAVPEELSPLFISAGVFEGISIRHSRRFERKTK